MQDAKEEVRSRLDIEDVIGQYVELRRAGRNLKALSPFTSEKTPSFIVSPEKQIWHDFSSNKGGDVFSFIMEVEGMNFREALVHLANKAGVDLSMYDSGNSAEVTRKRKRLLEANSLAQKYFQHSLTKNKHAIEYIFYRRNFNRGTVENFGLGYAPNTGKALVDFLTKKGFSAKELRDAGLTNRYDGDLFKSRMVVPLMDSTGATIGFTGRIIDDKDKNAPKYLNTPETLIYNKSRHVFGLSQAKDSIRKQDFAVVVEGNLDVVSSHQAGVKNVVATAGTAMTEQHLKAILRFSPNIRLAFDGDKAGLAAAERAIGIAQNLGIELSIISDYEDAKDPDELIQKDPNLWKKAIEDHQPAIDWLLGQYEGKLDLSTAAGKREYSTIAVNLINQLTDAVVQDHYYKLVADKLDSSPDVLKNKLQVFQDSIKPKSKKPVKISPQEIEAEDVEQAANQDTILALGLFCPKLKDRFSQLRPEDFSGADRQSVLKAIQKGQESAICEPRSDSLDKMTTDIDTYTKVLLLRAETRYSNWDESELLSELNRLLELSTLQKLKKQKEQLTQQLKDAEELGDFDKSKALLAEINDLNKEINSAKK